MDVPVDPSRVESIDKVKLLFMLPAEVRAYASKLLSSIDVSRDTTAFESIIKNIGPVQATYRRQVYETLVLLQQIAKRGGD